MRTTIALGAVLLSCCGAASAAPNDRPPGPIFALEPRDPSATVIYRFTVASVRSDAPPDGYAPPAPEPQTIRFAFVDPKHERLTLLDASHADTQETLLADRTADGQLHAKLERGSEWAIPLALYDRVTALAILGAGAQPEVPTDAKLQPLASGDFVTGQMVVHPGPETHVLFDGSGSVVPSLDLFARPGGPNGNPYGGGRGGRGGGFGGGFGGAGGFGGGRGGRGGGERTSQPADATLHVDAEFDRATFGRVDGTETLAYGDADRKRERTWSIVRVP